MLLQQCHLGNCKKKRQMKEAEEATLNGGNVGCLG